MDHRSDWFYSGDIYVQPTLNDVEDDTPIIECKHITTPIQLLEEIFEQLPLVFENRYWVLQNKYCHFIASINFNAIEKIFGHDKAQTYKVIGSTKTKKNIFNMKLIYFIFCFSFHFISFQNRFILQLYQMLRDSDARIRNEAASALFELYCSQFIDESCKNSSISEFVAEILSNEVPFSLNSPMEPLNGFHLGINSTKCDYQQIKRVLGKYLFDLANMLFALKSSEQLVSN